VPISHNLLYGTYAGATLWGRPCACLALMMVFLLFTV